MCLVYWFSFSVDVHHLLCDILTGGARNVFYVMLKYWSRIFFEAHQSYTPMVNLGQKGSLEVFQMKLCLLDAWTPSCCGHWGILTGLRDICLL